MSAVLKLFLIEKHDTQLHISSDLNTSVRPFLCPMGWTKYLLIYFYAPIEFTEDGPKRETIHRAGFE